MKKLTGIVVSTKMKNLAVVRVDRRQRHPFYQKTVKRSQRYLVHDEAGVKEGDVVTIVECRPLSRRKRWKIVGDRKHETEGNEQNMSNKRVSSTK